MRIIGGARWLDEPLGQNIGGGLEPLGPHEVGAYEGSLRDGNFIMGVWEILG